VEVHVGDQRHAHLRDDLGEGLGVLALGHGDADEVGAGGGELVDLGHARVDVVRVAAGHGLDADGCVAADPDGADAAVAERDLSCGASIDHGAWGFLTGAWPDYQTPRAQPRGPARPARSRGACASDRRAS
jgi:hypothetical protein